MNTNVVIYVCAAIIAVSLLVPLFLHIRKIKKGEAERIDLLYLLKVISLVIVGEAVGLIVLLEIMQFIKNLWLNIIS